MYIFTHINTQTRHAPYLDLAILRVGVPVRCIVGELRAQKAMETTERG
jgi:hypothetical protein